MKKISKIVSALLVSVIGILICYQPATLHASGNTLERLSIAVDLQTNGNARISQTWQAELSEGTEFFLPIENLGGKEIKDFTVKDGAGKEYTLEPDWDVDNSFDEKAYKYGIIDKGGDSYELCWGISSYGVQTYVVSYTITNVIESYDDYDGFNFQFINSGMGLAPHQFDISMSYKQQPFTPENTGIWAFGYNGTIHLVNGKIVANADYFDSSNYANIMARFEKGIFAPDTSRNGDFASLVAQAFEGSDYSFDEYQASGGDTQYVSNTYEQPMPTALKVAIGAGITALLAFFGVIIADAGMKSYTYGNSASKLRKTEDYYREITFDGYIPATVAALLKMGIGTKSGNIMGAFLLRFVQDGNVQIHESTRQTFFGSKESTEIHFIQKPEERVARGLYALLNSAAGNDGILQEKEFSKWLQKNSSKLSSWNDNVFNEFAEKNLKENGYIKVLKDKGIFKKDIEVLNEKGEMEVKHTMDLKHFLEDFSIINERHPEEVHLWKDYLVYASLFDIADQVAKDLKNLYPNEFATYTQMSSDQDLFRTLYLVNHFSNSYETTLNAMESGSAGGGGGASGGGGGGFSGGGSGGGTR